ncbi:IS3 family transposase [Streptomyces sp. NPDC101213]|uniref:IS3 family transposase n=1 Tax=unclassified Streptomyces TaxID=2593676 RepID=UPI0036F7D931
MLITLLGVSESGYYSWRRRPPSIRSLRHVWLSRAILEIHRDSDATFGYRRVKEEIERRYGINVSRATVELLMHRAGIRGEAGRPHRRILRPPVEASGRRWIVDVQVCETVRGHLCAAVVLDTALRRPVGWSTAGTADGALVRRALDAAVARGAAMSPSADAGSTRMPTCSFTERAGSLGFAPASGETEDWYDHGVVEIFWKKVGGELGPPHLRPEPHALGAALLEIFQNFSEK